MRACWVLKLNLLNKRNSVTTFLICILFFFVGFIDRAYAAETCESSPVAQIVSVQGVIELRRANESIWRPAVMNATLCPGDMVRARSRSRAALRLSNESMLRLDQRTTLTFPHAEQDKATSLLDLIKGAIHIITRTPKPFEVRTPYLNAAVDGTEFFVGVDEDSTKLVIYEGQVTASNDQGSLILVDHEAAIATKHQAPQKEVVLRPTDAVQWALYYPAIIDYQSDASIERDEISTLIRDAAHLLTIGRVDEARAAIKQVLEIAPAKGKGTSDAYALKSIIAMVQNDKDAALHFATNAADLDQTSATARLALSYVQQAHFEIDDALTSVQEAIAIDAQNALAWARLAELHMSKGYLRRALDAARHAVGLNPDLAKTQSVLGFAHLLKVDTEAAKANFVQAIALDQADPMPRLGLGLALIREGALEAGRIELEIAASLDPANSLIRSYLGKAYFEEKRYELAETQFDLAKARDPNDPTPWFYDAIQKQTQNRPVEALSDVQKSIELNDNRAVYRSKLLLDQDQAGRGSSLARIYDNLGFEKRALMETAKSLSVDPANHSAHRFLSDAYTNVSRHEVARVSELLQAQLMQPVNVNPVQPHLAVADLNIITGTGPTVAGFNEFAPLMERNKPQLVGSAIVGSNSTVGNETVLSAVYDRASASIGQYHFQSDGFRENNDQKHNIYNAFVQYAVTPKLNVQAEIRRRQTENGDLLLDFDTTSHRNLRRNLEQDTVRVGARYALSPRQDFLVSAMYADRREANTLAPALGVGINSALKDKGYQIEGQYLFREKYFNLIAGGGAYKIDAQSQLQVCQGPCFPSPAISFNRERENAYAYSNFNYAAKVDATLGLSYDSYKNGVDTKFDTFNPKFGLQWNISDALRLRFAWFETVKAALIANQTLEPTQVAGFNQLFDDTNGTRSRRMGVGLDAYFTKSIYGGVEVSERDLKVPFVDQAFVLSATEKQQERLYRSYLYWLPHANWAVNGEFQFERYTRNATDIGGADKPYQIQTLSAPLIINYFHPSGFFSKFTTTYVQQNLQRLPTSTLRDGTDDFVLFDAAIGYRLPNRRGLVSLEGRNLSNETFFYRNVNFQINEAITPRFIPTRTFFARVTLNF
jgi:tetratricopeptide (TPR) repeat protein